MAKQTFTTGQVLTAAQVNALQTNDFNQTVSAKTASYILVAADKGTRIEFNTSGSVTCTVNTGLFDAGDTVYIQNTGAGVVTITAGTATVNTSASLTVNQYEGGVLYFVSASSAIWFEYASTATGDITGITTGATSGLTGGVTSGTADLKFNTTAKGGLLVGTGSGTVSELTVGANNTILTADSSTATGLKWAAASSGALVFINSTSFSAVASQSFNNVFSDTYTNYKVFINIYSSDNNVELRWRFRVSGTDITTNYMSALFQIGAGNTTQTLGGATTYMDLGNLRGASVAPAGYDLTVYQPRTGSIRRPVSFIGLNSYGDPGTDGAYWGAGQEQNGGGAYDGFTLLASTGTITGTVRIYGLANS